MKEYRLNPNQLKEVHSQILDRLDKLSGRVLVIGDIGLDEYLFGKVSRLSREAPIPVFDIESQEQRLGLAANVANNIYTLGGEALILSVIGTDETGTQLREQLNKEQLSCEYLIDDESRLTTRKSRLIAGNHHVARMDRQRQQFLSPSMESRLLKAAHELIPSFDVVVVEDYAYGVLSETVIQSVIKLSHQANKQVLVDPAPTTPPQYYYEADTVTPNQDEAFRMASFEINGSREQTKDVLSVGSKLRETLNCSSLIMTRGGEGMSLFSHNDEVFHLPTYAREVFDVTGAGDTVVAALALGVTMNLSHKENCVLANFAAGIVVGQMGCVPCHRKELKDYILGLTD